MPELTYVASENIVKYCGAQPVCCDVSSETGCLDPRALKAVVSKRTKVIMPVHLFGVPAAMNEIHQIAAEVGAVVIEDAAEALGARYHNKSIGDANYIACFSFFGNKVLTTGEGGMCTTNSAGLAEKLRLFRGQGVDPERSYWHAVIGYNYRMTDLQASLGLGQLARLDELLERRRELYSGYLADLQGLPLWTPLRAWMRADTVGVSCFGARIDF